MLFAITSCAGDSREHRKLHLVGKDKTFVLKENGGLGIRSQKLINQAYMAKLGWKVSQGPSNLSQECIRSKYIHVDHATKFENGSHIWKNIGRSGTCFEKIVHGPLVP